MINIIKYIKLVIFRKQINVNNSYIYSNLSGPFTDSITTTLNIYTYMYCTIY